MPREKVAEGSREVRRIVELERVSRAWKDEAANVWYRATIDVAAQITQRPGWDTARLAFVSQHSSANRTNFMVDRVQLDVCRRTGLAGAAAAKPVTRPLSIRPLRAPRLDRAGAAPKILR